MKVTLTYLAVLFFLAVLTSVWDAQAGSDERGETTVDANRAVARESGTELSGEELWSNNCQRCHNMRSPTMYTPAQWGVIVHHMRVRANITGAEQRAIADFLKSASR